MGLRRNDEQGRGTGVHSSELQAFEIIPGNSA